jgi:mannose-1-phosphate guanylyltransferase
LVADPESSEVMHYVEKPETFVSDLISCGVYAFNPSIFNSMRDVVHQHLSRADLEEDDSLAGKPGPDSVRLEQDVLRPLAGTGSLYVFKTEEFWRQIKTAG